MRHALARQEALAHARRSLSAAFDGQRAIIVMPPAGTFEYQVTVPEAQTEASYPWPARLRAPVRGSANPLRQPRLVGYSPELHITNAGFTPDTMVFSRSGTRLPRTIRSRFTLSATEKELATVARACFHVDEGVTSRLRVGDVINMSRTACAGLGISVVREGRLVVAAGAVTSVSLGADVAVRVPNELIDEAEAVFHKRDPQYRFEELPIELRVDDETRLLAHGWSRLGAYEVYLVRGFLPGIPGTNECLGIARVGVGGDTTASCTALLLGVPGALEMVNW